MVSITSFKSKDGSFMVSMTIADNNDKYITCTGAISSKDFKEFIEKSTLLLLKE